MARATIGRRVLHLTIGVLAVAASAPMVALAQSGVPSNTAEGPLTEGSLEVRPWLDGVATRYVSEVLFDDTNFNRYRPYANPYAAITHALENMPADKLDLAISRYGTGIPDGLAPFRSNRNPFGKPESNLFQRADYSFKNTCTSCPERVSFHSDSVGITFHPEGPNAKPGTGTYVSIALTEVSAAHFEKYPFLREVFELHSLMLNARNPQSYIYQRERSIHHGLQAVLNFVRSRNLQLSEHAEKQLKENAKLSLNDRIQRSLDQDVKRETGINPNARPGGWDRLWADQYPFQSAAGKSVLIKAIVDSVFAEGSAKASAMAVRTNYSGRLQYAAYEFAEFRNQNLDWPKDLGPRPPMVRAMPWWSDMGRWLPTERVNLIVPTCDGSFIRM